jgi:hypothetical protein
MLWIHAPNRPVVHRARDQNGAISLIVATGWLVTCWSQKM